MELGGRIKGLGSDWDWNIWSINSVFYLLGPKMFLLSYSGPKFPVLSIFSAVGQCSLILERYLFCRHRTKSYVLAVSFWNLEP